VKHNILILLLPLIVWGCANRIQPTGGPRDEEPPRVVASNPEHGARNYQAKEVVIEFDEFITVKNLKEQLLITPRIDGNYEFKIRKRTISLEFEQPFEDSTTYTLNFREAIVDITEGNPAKNMLLAFSTGNLLDTLEISGVLIDLLTRAPIESAIVGLYPVDDTLDIFSGPPYYFTQTNDQGHYLLSNIKDGSYRLYAFTDGNKNLTCESDREGYAFKSQSIQLDTAYYADTLNLQYLNIDTLKVIRTRASGRYFNVFANKYITHAKLKAENDSTIIFKYTEDHRGLKLYNTFPISDSLNVWVELQDSLGLIAKDSFYLKFTDSGRSPDEFKATITSTSTSPKKKILSGEITFDKPLQTLTLDSIVIKRDSLENYYIYNSLAYAIDTLENILTFNIDIPTAILDSINNIGGKSIKSLDDLRPKAESKAVYTLSIPQAAFISIENDSSLELNSKLKFIKPALTGLINGSISTGYNSFTVQLLNKNMEVVKEHHNGKKYTFDEVLPGEYFIRIFVDENENGVWDMAEIRNNIQAEKVILYKDETGTSKTVIRANWEVTIDLSF